MLLFLIFCAEQTEPKEQMLRKSYTLIGKASMIFLKKYGMLFCSYIISDSNDLKMILKCKHSKAGGEVLCGSLTPVIQIIYSLGKKRQEVWPITNKFKCNKDSRRTYEGHLSKAGRKAEVTPIHKHIQNNWELLKNSAEYNAR